MIFIQIKTEEKVQVDDMTRIDATSSFISPDESEITLVEIEPELGSGFIDVTSSKYLDWAYESTGEKSVSVRITTDGMPITKTHNLSVVSVSDDRLFSNDSDIISHENDLFRFLREGRVSFLDVHRVAQGLILDYLDQTNVTNIDGSRVEKDDIYEIKEVKEWSKFLTLSLIFESVANEVEDIFSVKARKYRNMAKEVSARASVKIGDSANARPDQNLDLRSARIVRR
jgi:hypothetical protein